MPRRKDGGGIYLRRPRPTQGCTADDDDDVENKVIYKNKIFSLVLDQAPSH